MNERSRLYGVGAIGVVALVVVGRFGGDWSHAAFYAAGARVIVLGASLGLLWVQMAPDGDLRRPRR